MVAFLTKVYLGCFFLATASSARAVRGFGIRFETGTGSGGCCISGTGCGSDSGSPSGGNGTPLIPPLVVAKAACAPKRNDNEGLGIANVEGAAALEEVALNNDDTKVLDEATGAAVRRPSSSDK